MFFLSISLLVGILSNHMDDTVCILIFITIQVRVSFLLWKTHHTVDSTQKCTYNIRGKLWSSEFNLKFLKEVFTVVVINVVVNVKCRVMSDWIGGKAFYGSSTFIQSKFSCFSQFFLTYHFVIETNQSKNYDKSNSGFFTY